MTKTRGPTTTTSTATGRHQWWAHLNNKTAVFYGACGLVVGILTLIVQIQEARIASRHSGTSDSLIAKSPGASSFQVPFYVNPPSEHDSLTGVSGGNATSSGGDSTSTGGNSTSNRGNSLSTGGNSPSSMGNASPHKPGERTHSPSDREGPNRPTTSEQQATSDRNSLSSVAPAPPSLPAARTASLTSMAIATLRSGGIVLSITGRSGVSEQLAQGLRNAGFNVATSLFSGIAATSAVRQRLEEGDTPVLSDLGVQGAPGTVVIGRVDFDPISFNGQFYMTYANISVTIWRLNGNATQRTLRSRGADFNETGAYQQAIENSTQKLVDALK